MSQRSQYKIDIGVSLSSLLPCIHSTVWVYSVDSILLPIKIIEELRPFQDDVADMCELEPDDRKIVWVFDPLVNMDQED